MKLILGGAYQGKRAYAMQVYDLLEEDFYSNEVSQIPQLDIDKAWNGLLFLLTGGSLEDAENHILGKVILGSADIDKKKIIGYSSSQKR